MMVLNVETAMQVLKSTCQRSLTYACESLDISRSHLKELDTAQAKLIKCIVELGPKYRSTPLLQTMGIQSISATLAAKNLTLFNNIMKTESVARKFYLFTLFNSNKCPANIVYRIKHICEQSIISLYKVCVCEKYVSTMKKEMFQYTLAGSNDLVDSIRTVLCNESAENMFLFRLLLKAF